MGPGGEGWGPTFPFVSLYGYHLKFLQDTAVPYMHGVHR